MMRRWLLLMLLSITCAAKAGEMTYLTGMQLFPNKSETKVVFLLSQKTTGRVNYVPQQNKLTVMFTQCLPRFVLTQPKLAGSNMRALRSDILPRQTLQYTFLLTTPITHRAQFTVDPIHHTASLTLRMISLQTEPVATTKIKPAGRKKMYRIDIQKTFAVSIEKNNEEMRNDKLISQAQAINLTVKKPRFITVMIDAGHGGHDSGALGIKGTKEKTVALAIAKKVADRINQQTNMRAILTRKGDYFVSLRERLRLARKSNADLFIAIHADASMDDDASGASVYALSERGATTVAARWLADRENHEELGDVPLYGLQDQSKMLRSVLIDLAQTNTTANSLQLGKRVLDALDDVTRLHYKRVEQAPFLVLKSPDIPSVLIETGYISNPSEELRLANKKYQQKMANAIWKGIDRYIETSFLKSMEGANDGM